jgi:hypothetical protein
MATQNLFISEMSFNKFVKNVVSAYIYTVKVFRILGVGIHNLIQKNNKKSNICVNDSKLMIIIKEI